MSETATMTLIASRALTPVWRQLYLTAFVHAHGAINSGKFIGTSHKFKPRVTKKRDRKRRRKKRAEILGSKTLAVQHQKRGKEEKKEFEFKSIYAYTLT
jgi:hypothetical protein